MGQVVSLLFCSFYRGGAGSPLAWHPPRPVALFYFLPKLASFPRGEFQTYGIAKLLPLIVPVKRETLHVVSPAMTGLMRGVGIGFPQIEFMVCSQSSSQYPVTSNPTPPVRKTIQKERRLGLGEPRSWQGWGDLRAR